MPNSEARLERVMSRVVEALEAQNECMRQQTDAILAMTSSNHRLADALERENREEPDTEGLDLARRDTAVLEGREYVDPFPGYTTGKTNEPGTL